MTKAVSFFSEMRRRGMFGATAIYIVAAWVFVQVASETFPAFNIPEFAIRYVWIGVILLLPMAMIVGWFYDISTNGIRRTPRAASADGADIPLKRSDYTVLSGLTVVALGIVAVLLTEIVKLQGSMPQPAAVRVVDPNSVAILPLDNYTGESEQEYFVAALHEALTAGLASISALTVISRTSASAFRGSDKPLPEIGQVLGVAKIIEGSVFKSGDRVRITLQLIDALTDEHLWAENFEREMRDLMALQSEVTRAVTRQIRVTLTPEEEDRLDTLREVDPVTQRLYLKGMYFLNQFTPAGIQKGMDYLQQAVANDPANPRAYAGLALGYNTIGHGVGRDAFPKALAAARRALELDPYSGEAWAALAEAQLYHDYAWEASEKAFRRAIQLAPSLDHAHAHYAYLLALFGRWDEAFHHSAKARELNPLEPLWVFFTGWLHSTREEFEQAEELYLEALALSPDFPFVVWGLGEVYRMQGREDEALELHQRIAEPQIRNWALAVSYAVAGRTEDAYGRIAEMTTDPGPKEKLFIGITYAALGDNDQAIEWLEDCFETRVDWFPWVALKQSYGGALEGIRPDPRFQSLVERLDIQFDSE
jgi:TolB-like protein/tetratricopeptide (TPR) repeat protein